MNKKDLKELAKKSALKSGEEKQNAEQPKTLLTKQDLVDAITAAFEKLQGDPPDLAPGPITAEPLGIEYKVLDRVKDPVWWKMYVGIVGGQVGWLSAAMNDDAKFIGRLEILANIAKAATNYAVKRGMVAPDPDKKK